MSYELTDRGRVRTPEEVRRHVGDLDGFKHRFLSVASRYAAKGREGLRTIAPHLFDWISDHRMHRLSWNHLAQFGGEAPGRDERRIDDYVADDAWAICRALEKTIRAGTYDPADEKISEIVKDSGIGKRRITLLELFDRLVQRSIAYCLRPFIEVVLDDSSFGYRRRIGRFHALALARQKTAEQGQFVWLTPDLTDAFTHVPIPRLLDLLRMLFPDDRLIEFLEGAITSRRQDGLRQGGAASPELMVLFAHYFIILPWKRYCPDIPIFIFSDDILILCKNIAQARAADSRLREILRSTGMHVKHSFETAACDLQRGQKTSWLGFEIAKAGESVSFQIMDDSWDRLRQKLGRAHRKSFSQHRAKRIVAGWLRERGPAFQWSDVDYVVRRVIRTARRFGFEEIGGTAELKEICNGGLKRWQGIVRALSQEDSFF